MRLRMSTLREAYAFLSTETTVRLRHLESSLQSFNPAKPKYWLFPRWIIGSRPAADGRRQQKSSYECSKDHTELVQVAGPANQ
jgi:hypothetical protein